MENTAGNARQCHPDHQNSSCFPPGNQAEVFICRVQRKSVLQPAIRASCSEHVLAHKWFQLAQKPFLISRIDYNPSVIWISPQNSTCPSGKLRTKITSPAAKSASPGQSDTTFFARWYGQIELSQPALSYEHIKNFTKDFKSNRGMARSREPVQPGQSGLKTEEALSLVSAYMKSFYKRSKIAALIRL